MFSKERTLRREFRRQKQRLTNIDRAAKMHALRIAYDKENKRTITVSLNEKEHKYFIGSSGWFYWHWRNIFYPQDLPMSAWFTYYASKFKTVELNAPFYSWPTLATIKAWQQQASHCDFIYTIKVCELITHIKTFKNTKVLIRDFGLIADLLGSRMGCFLFQLPPSFYFTIARLNLILTQLDHNRRNVVEFRHPSWWNKEVYKAFQEHGTIFCSCSAPRLPNELIKTSDDIYIRFHGVKKWYDHDYRAKELEEWTKKISDSNPKHVWAYFNNDRGGNAIRNALTFYAQQK
ncbi:DUF72 domain-containing protein [Nitrosomonas supralitoralis]|uniref:DUF72 domain-containing protein n=1 Tax=Nitrosomonas supralitoralis TaxID=2116706 RepID=UPI0018D54299|nr:DUF72 domain-containing protein [Nitrosomonas supralitoralis]